MSVVLPRSFGLTFSPPTITLVYSLDGKLRTPALPDEPPHR